MMILKNIMNNTFYKKIILITGAAGTVGQSILNQLFNLKEKPKKKII